MTPSLSIAGTPSVATGDAPSSTFKRLSKTVTKNIWTFTFSFLQTFHYKGLGKSIVSMF
jgi:hypothetical protein